MIIIDIKINYSIDAIGWKIWIRTSISIVNIFNAYRISLSFQQTICCKYD